MRRILLVPFVMFVGCGAAVVCGASPVPEPSPQISLADKWAGELAVRTEQSDAIKTAGAKVLAEAQPFYDEQVKVEAEEKPLKAEEARLGKELDNYNAGKPAYLAQCTTRKFSLPSEQAAYDACEKLHQQREAVRIPLNKRIDDNYAKLEPLTKRWKELEDKMEPSKKAWEDLNGKFKAIQKEIARLRALIDKYRECTTLRARPATAAFTQLERETLHLCESIIFDGADPNLLLHDPTIASLDPNLPPLNWKPTGGITPNK
jgi:hypothetical protein